MLLFLAALQDLPTEVDEAAMVDGATRWNVFRYVTLPHLRPTLVAGAHPRGDRHLAGVRPDVRDDPGRPRQDDR